MMHMKTCDETSQMKGESVIVAVTDNNNKTFREHDFRKGQTPGGPNSCKVYIPFNSEYKIFVKNTNVVRIKIDAELDGTNITENGLILSANGSIYLERFLGGEGKKFLFVPVDSDAVGDPTSKENGILRIKVAKEKAVEIKTVEHHHHYNYYHDYWNDPYRRTLIPTWTTYTSHDSSFIVGSTNTGMGNLGASLQGKSDSGNSLRGDIGSMSVNFCSSSAVPSLDGPTLSDLNVQAGAVGQAGATVEGGKSNQQFTTTDWNGDNGTSYTFVFKLLGIANELSEKDKAEFAEWQRLQEKFGKK